MGAAKAGNRNVLQWMMDLGADCHTSYACDAAYNCHTEIVEWMSNYDSLTESAIQGGHHDIVEYIWSLDKISS